MPSSIKSIVIGSRGSDLALWQAHHVKALLERTYPGLLVTIEIIHTTGDKVLDTSLSLIGGKGLFTKEIEVALLDKRIDIAVHSLKDLPTVIEPELVIAAVPERASVEDVFLAKDTATTLMDLPDEATIATGSLRRKAQLLSRRPDLQVVDIRGNVPTRIKKLLESNWDGMILASAGVERLGLTEYVCHKISLEWVLPAVGQGALGIQCRAEDTAVRDLLAPLNDLSTLQAVTAERALLRVMGGGCQVPIGAHGIVMNGELELSGCVAGLDGQSVIRAVHRGKVDDAAQIGAELAKTLLESGGQKILDQVFRLQMGEANVTPHPEV